MASLPDVKDAFIKRLETHPVVMPETSRIGGGMKQAWTNSPGKAIILRINGSPGIERWYETGMHPSRLDFEFYGKNPEEAYGLWLTVHPVICPGQDSGGTELHSFVQNDCRIYWTELESGPFELVDDITRLPFTMASYVVLWSKVPVS